MRPYHDDLSCENQLQHLREINCQTILLEEHSSAKKRTELKQMLNNLKPRDKIVVTKLFTFADSTRHLVELLEVLETKGAYIQTIIEGIDTSNRSGYSFIDIVKHLAELQSEIISEKQKKVCLKPNNKDILLDNQENLMNVNRAIIMYQSKHFSISEIEKATSISKSTLYRYLEN